MLETDASAFNCETCPVRVQIDELDDENRQAWQLFHRVCTRFLVDTHAVGYVLERLTAEEDVEDLADLMTRLSILYNAYYPVRRAPDGA